jgi:eukaryotic-like serine/threonine-protein kinase
MKTADYLAEMESRPPGTPIRLPRGVWFYEPLRPLGPKGGFGEVFEGVDQSGNEVAVKRLHVDAAAAAHRELTIADDLAGRTLNHVLPVFDAGQDAETGAYFVVMPRAHGSLSEHIRSRGGRVEEAEAVQILQDIVAGLIEVGDIVHRDLKPANVLMHEGQWKIADFGIARFVADATASNTLKDALTAPFAAPEQWTGEHATNATDVYALGCVAHVLVTGQPPFSGPKQADFQRQHLSETAPALAQSDARLRYIVAAALRKPQSGRPAMRRVATVLAEISAQPTPVSKPLSALQRVNAIEAERVSEELAKAEVERRKQAERDALVNTGTQMLRAIAAEMTSAAKHHAQEAKISSGGQELLRLSMGVSGAELVFKLDGAVPSNVNFSPTDWHPIAIGSITVQQKIGGEWSHGATLWFMRLRDGEYRWYEVSYKRNPMMEGRQPPIGPSGIQVLVGGDIYGHAAAAAGPGMSHIEIESRPTPIDDENVEGFIERWLGRFAAAYEGKLRPY